MGALECLRHMRRRYRESHYYAALSIVSSEAIIHDSESLMRHFRDGKSALSTVSKSTLRLKLSSENGFPGTLTRSPEVLKVIVHSLDVTPLGVYWTSGGYHEDETI